MDKSTRDYMEVRVKKFNKLESEKNELERMITKIDESQQASYVEVGGHNVRIPEGARQGVSNSIKDAYRKRIGEIERLMEEI